MEEPRVCIVPEYPLSLMTGGTLVQAEETYETLAKMGKGLTAELFSWSERRPVADLYHFISVQRPFFRLIDLIREAGRPYVITLLSGNPGNRSQVWIAAARHLLKVHCLRRRDLWRTLHGAAAIIAVTRSGAEALRRIFWLEKNRLHVVPHGIHQRFFECSPTAWQEAFGPKPFVLSVGAIQRRKNQLLLLEAANQLRLPVVLLGPVLSGEGEYAQHVAAAAKQNESFGGRWLQTLQNNDPLLLSAHAACRLVVLLSQSETQPLSVMQALAARRPVLLLRAPYASERPFNDLSFLESPVPAAVANALQREWDHGRPTSLPAEFTWPNVGIRLREIYMNVLQGTKKELTKC